MKSARSDRLNLGPFVLDLARRGLFRDGVRLHLTPKPFETLAYLVEHRDRTVPKQELLDHVWAGTAVTEGVLSQAVREIRRALDDDADDPAFVLTIPREGYRFVGPVEATESVAAATGRTSDEARPRAQRRLSASRVLSVVALAAVVLLIGLLDRRSPPASSARQAASSEAPALLERLAPVTPVEVSAVKPAFSPDGSEIAYVSDGDVRGVLDLFVIDATGHTPRRLTRSANASGDLPVFTPDGGAVVFSRFRTGGQGGRIPDLWRVRVTGSEPVLFIPGASGAGFSPDGRQVTYTRHAEPRPALYSGPIESPDRHRELARPGFMPRWSPDGRWIAFATANPEGRRGDVWIVSPDGAERRQLTHASAQIYGLAWAGPDRVVFASNQSGAYHLWDVRLDGARPRPLTSGVGDYFSPAVAPDASRIAFAYLRLTSELRLAALGPGAVSRVLARSDYHEMPRLSPSGRLVASLVSRADDGPRVYVIDPATSHARRVTDRPALGFCWVDEGRMAVLAPAADGATDLLLVGIDTAASVHLTRIAGEASWVAVRPDLRRIAFVRDADGVSQVVVRDLDTGLDAVLDAGRGLRAPRWSPDGQDVAWSASPQGADGTLNGVWIARPGAPARHVAADGYGPVWTRDGRGLYCSRYADANGGAGVWRLDLESGAATQVIRAQRVGDFDVVGEQLVYAIASGRTQVFTATLP